MKDKRKIDVNSGGFHINIKQRTTNEQQEGKECKMRTWKVEKLRIQKPQSAIFFLKNDEFDLVDSWNF